MTNEPKRIQSAQDAVCELAMEFQRMADTSIKLAKDSALKALMFEDSPEWVKHKENARAFLAVHETYVGCTKKADELRIKIENKQVTGWNQ